MAKYLITHSCGQHIPRQQTKAIATRIESLWSKRNQCLESEIEAIDNEMFLLANVDRRYA